MPKINPDTGEVIQTRDGAEILDSTPMAPPVGYKKQPSMVEYIRDMVRSERLRQEAEAAGAETWEEADDFDVGEDYDPSSPYEGDFEPIDNEALRAQIDAHRSAELSADERPAGPEPKPKASPAKPKEPPPDPES